MRSLRSAAWTKRIPIPTQDHPPLIVRGALQLFQPTSQRPRLDPLFTPCDSLTDVTLGNDHYRRQRRKRAAEDESVGMYPWVYLTSNNAVRTDAGRGRTRQLNLSSRGHAETQRAHWSQGYRYL